jgi:hypothetical protein
VWTADTVLMCALALLACGPGNFPSIVLLNSRPPDVSMNAEGFVRSGERRIYLLTDTASFEEARPGPLNSTPTRRRSRRLASSSRRSIQLRSTALEF